MSESRNQSAGSAAAEAADAGPNGRAAKKEEVPQKFTDRRGLAKFGEDCACDME